MKWLIVFAIICSASFAIAQNINYTASTPAAPVVKKFLGIPLKDSVDFIRWKLTLQQEHYTLQCNYGISKPNTNGFINGGAAVSLTGKLIKEKNYYRLEHNNNQLKLAQLNPDLLHISDLDNNLLTGNGGWSYTLNNINPAITNKIYFTAKQNPVEDSIVFDGRTPCGVPGIIPAGQLCYKIKWRIILYGDETAKSGTWRSIRGTSGRWEIVTGKGGQLIYKLNSEEGKGMIYLIRPDDNLLLFTDAKGRLFTGNEDFSYTLNRVEPNKS